MKRNGDVGLDRGRYVARPGGLLLCVDAMREMNYYYMVFSLASACGTFLLLAFNRRSERDKKGEGDLCLREDTQAFEVESGGKAVCEQQAGQGAMVILGLENIS